MEKGRNTLSNIDLSYCTLLDKDMSGFVFDTVSFHGTRFYDVDFSKAKFNNCDFSEAICVDVCSTSVRWRILTLM